MQTNIISLKYPATKTVDQKDDYHGTLIADPYRWLEVDTAEEVEAWVQAQNALTFDYLSKIPYRKQLEDRYTELFNYSKYGIPIRAGAYYLFAKNDGLQNQAVWYIQRGLEGKPEIFLDPNQMSKDGTVAVSFIGLSKDKRYFTYSKSSAGSDWSEIHIIEIASKQVLPDVLKWVKFSAADWSKDGFFYSRYPEPAKGTEYSGNNQFHSVYYHKLGDLQPNDVLIYEDRENPNYYHNAEVSEDGRYLIIQAAPGTDGFATYYKDLEKDTPITLLFKGYANKSYFIYNIGTKFLILTDIDAPNYRLIELDVTKPDPSNWKDILPNGEHLLQGVSTGGGKMFVNYLVDATDRYYQMNYDGSDSQEIELPGLGTVSGFGGDKDDPEQFYSFTSFIYPSTIFRYDPVTRKSAIFFKSDLQFNPLDFVEKQVFYTSKDGTKVPMFIVHKKDLQLDGQNPTQLYGYGGFNISLTPSFSASRLILLENGGVFAMPNLRGGGEYGEAWHQSGMLDKKQNVFDDFIAAAEYLIEAKYTSKAKLAMAGGSNGGLLVGAVMTQRPDLFAVALPAVSVLDMLRYHRFTIGKGWIPEYGSADDPEQFKFLIQYSPLHNLKAGVQYPSTLITTADHDDRVVPAHSFKFAAQLQQAHAGANPVLIRIDTNAGHGAGKPTSKVIEEQADIWAFFFYNTHSPLKYPLK